MSGERAQFKVCAPGQVACRVAAESPGVGCDLGFMFLQRLYPSLNLANPPCQVRGCLLSYHYPGAVVRSLGGGMGRGAGA